MFTSPYDTTVCRTHKINEIKRDLQQAMIAGELPSVGNRVFAVGPNVTHIKPFAHPMVVMDSSRNTSIVADVRSSARLNKTTGDLTGSSDFTFTKLRAQLMQVAWVEGNPRDLLNTSDYQVKIFARLISENLARRMNLNAQTQMRVNVITAMYYLHLFRDEPLKNEDEYLAMAKRVSRITAMPMDRVLEITDDVDGLMNINEYCTTLIKQGGSIRLEKLTPALIFTMLGGIWFGANNMEVVAVALEHPPTWCAMLAMVIDDRGYRKTILGQLIQNTSRRDDQVEVFSKNINRLVRSSTS